MSGLRRHFAALEGMRAVAAIMVVLYHFSAVHRYSYNDATLGRTIGRFGSLGVCIFFLLSGFVLYRPRVVRQLQRIPQEPLHRYIPFRLLRLVPAYWLALTFLLLAFWNQNPFRLPPGESPVSVTNLVRFYGLLQIYDPAYAIRGLGVAWTLCVEVAFYLALPAVAWCIGKVANRAQSIEAFRRRQLFGIAVFGAAGVLSRVVLLSNPETRAKGVTWPISFLDWFALGMGLAVLSTCAEQGARSGWISRELFERPRASFAAAGVAFAALAMYVPPLGVAQSNAEIHGRFILNGAVSVLLLGPLVMATSSPVHQFLERPSAQFLGKVSYGIYLWHMIWMRAGLAWADQGLIPRHPAAQALLVALLTLAISVVSFHLAEQPVMDWKARLRGRDKHAAQSPTLPAPVPQTDPRAPELEAT